MILLHGLNGTGEEVEAYVQLRPLAAERGFLYCTPNASTTPQGDRAWQWPYWNNETDVSAFLVPQGIPYLDEVGYLRGLIEEIATHFAVDRKRVYVLGYSNGAFMAYRMAYEAADLVAGIVGLAAVTRIDGPDFLPSEPVNILHVHGTSDKFYTSYAVPGGTLLLGAVRSTQIWAGYNGAHDPVTDPAPTMDLDLALPGLDTVVTRYTSHPPGGAVELWTINGGSHHPALSSEFSPRVIDWLLAHPKP
jgi:polyhydroxybutyrate depolymerase